jgi:transcriptional regulator with GAF, ATPase, and Fis domain
MESELFGHERGAFTGADAPRDGRFELARGGSILLDEVTEIDLPLQAKLLRVLQEKTFERVGSSHTIHADVRVLATTNRDLRAEVVAGRFREDLYYRLAVVPLSIPPLRERPEDILLLANHFLVRAAERLGRKPLTLADRAAELLLQYPWPGNVRELENIMTRASVLNPAATLTDDDLRRWLSSDEPPAHGRGDRHLLCEAREGRAPSEGSSRQKASVAFSSPAPDVPVGMRLEEMERKLIEATLEHFGGHRAKTAEALGIGIRTLSGKLREYGYAPREKSFSKAG